MNAVTRLPLLSHMRAEPSTFVLQYRRGRLVRSGRGLAFWFRPLTSSIAQLPMDDRELQLVFDCRTADFQDVMTQGVVTWRVADPAQLAARIDFSVDAETGLYLRTPLEQIAGLLTQLAQQLVWSFVTATPLREVLVDGVDQVRARIEGGLRDEHELPAMGIEIVAVRVSAISPTSEVEQALQTPAREQIQQQADEATFHRRAQAVEKERAIDENELQNRIELARREEQLVAQRGANSRLEESESAAAERIAAEGEAERVGLHATAEAARIELVEGAQNAIERDRFETYRELDPRVLLALAAREAAGKLTSIEHLNITPDMLSPALASLAAAGTRHLDEM